MSTAGIENINWQVKAGKDWKQAEDNTLTLTCSSIPRIHFRLKMAVAEGDCRDIAEFLDCMWQCYDNADKALTHERSCIPCNRLLREQTRGLVPKETVVLRRWRRETPNFWIVN